MSTWRNVTSGAADIRCSDISCTCPTLDKFGESEVTNFRNHVVVQQDVARLQVQMDDGKLAAVMEVVERLHHTGGDVEPGLPRERLVPRPVEVLVEAAILHVLEHDGFHGRGRTEPEQLDEIPMTKAPQSLQFSVELESCNLFEVLVPFQIELLQGDGGLGQRHLVHDAAAAHAERLVIAELKPIGVISQPLEIHLQNGVVLVMVSEEVSGEVGLAAPPLPSQQKNHGDRRCYGGHDESQKRPQHRPGPSVAQRPAARRARVIAIAAVDDAGREWKPAEQRVACERR